MSLSCEKCYEFISFLPRHIDSSPQLNWRWFDIGFTPRVLLCYCACSTDVCEPSKYQMTFSQNWYRKRLCLLYNIQTGSVILLERRIEYLSIILYYNNVNNCMNKDHSFVMIDLYLIMPSPKLPMYLITYNTILLNQPMCLYRVS